MSNTVTVGGFTDRITTIRDRFAGTAGKTARLNDTATMHYVLAGIRAEVLTRSENGRLTRGAGDAWAEAVGLSEDDAKRARQETTRALAALDAYAAVVAEDGIVVDVKGATCEDVDSLVACILERGSLAAQYNATREPRAPRGPRGAVELLATAARQAVAEEMSLDDFLAAARAAYVAADSAE